MTTTQIKQVATTHVFGATVSVVTGTPALNDSALGFLPSDVGRTVTTVSTAGRSVASVTSPGAAVMDGNASASTGPQVCTLTSVLANVTRDGANRTSKATPTLPTLAPGRLTLAVFAINMWTNCGGVGAAATRAQKILAAQGLFIQET